jgi:hypothetical protein
MTVLKIDPPEKENKGYLTRGKKLKHYQNDGIKDEKDSEGSDFN